MKTSHEMLAKFHEALTDGSFVVTGKHLEAVAQGVAMIKMMLAKSHQAMDFAKQMEKERVKAVKSSIQEQGGQIHAERTDEQNVAENVSA